MKQKRSFRLLPFLLLILVLVLVWAGSERRLRPAYLGIARLENKMKGIDGISAASVAKVKGDARRHSRFIRTVGGLLGEAREAPEANYDDFVEISEMIPDAARLLGGGVLRLQRRGGEQQRGDRRQYAQRTRHRLFCSERFL